MPSIMGPGRAGTRLTRMAALPRWSSTPSLPHRCETASPSANHLHEVEQWRLAEPALCPHPHQYHQRAAVSLQGQLYKQRIVHCKKKVTLLKFV